MLVKMLVLVMATMIVLFSCVESIQKFYCDNNCILISLVVFSCDGDLVRNNYSIPLNTTQEEYCTIFDNLKQEFSSNILKLETYQEAVPVVSEINNELILKQVFVPNISCFQPSDSSQLSLKSCCVCLRYSKSPKKISDKHLIEITEDSSKNEISPFFAIPIIIFCFVVSSLMSGLNIGLMSLDLTELQLLKNSGTQKEKKYAIKIIPLRQNGNYLLCSILLTATLCNSISTVLIDKFVDSYIAVAVTTLTIMILCEIFPQSICTYFPLFVGYHTVYITWACMVITAPLSYPLGKLLSLILGKEIVATYTKERLKELLKMTELPTNEEKIISGTLNLGKKKVEDVMTVLDDVFKLPISAIMDFETIAAILESGYSRIPIYDGDQFNMINVLLTKDLALLDPDDKVPVEMLVQHSKYKFTYIPKGTTLDRVFNIFKESRGHMAFVVEGNISDNEVIKHKIIGVVTFEDVIEEIFQEEINDETDAYFDNRSKRRLSKHTSNDLYSLLSKYSTRTSAPSENLKLAIFHFLSGIDVFSSKNISPKILLSVLSLDIYYSARGKKLPEDNIYVRGVPVDFFVMIVEGELEVRIGNEDLKLGAGAFKYFGVGALKKGPVEKYIPDYSLQAVKKTLYFKISKTLYNAAVLATNYEKHGTIPDINVKSELFKYFKLIIETDNIGPSSIKN